MGSIKMMMESFHNKFPDIAEKETRCIIVMDEKEGPPIGEYFLLESYCNDPKCDCRRVFINVLHKDKILATIGYGWENLEFYEDWIRDPGMAVDVKGPILELTGEYSEYSEALLKLFKKIMLKDEVFIERLRRHYKMFKKKINEGTNIENIEEETKERLENFEPEKYTVAELCKETGTGVTAINDNNREVFHPLLLAIEETIYLNYLENDSLRDSDVIDSLKKIRDNIFSDEHEFNELEEEIITKIKLILFLNKYDMRDVSLSISNIIKSAKLHRSVAGSRGYLDFISHFFNQMSR